MKGSSTSTLAHVVTDELTTAGFSPALLEVVAAAFLAALAFAILSRKALDDLDAFRAWFSTCCSGVSSSCRVDAAETYREGVEGDLVADVESAWGFLVFRTWSGLSGGPMSDRTGFESFFAREGRAGEALAGTRPKVLAFPGAAFLSEAPDSAIALPEAILCLADGNRIFEGLSLASVTFADARDEAEDTDMRGWEGNRSLETG